jgi:hypothetical protein
MDDDEDESLFVSDVNAASHRGAVLDDDGTTGWLYLTEAGGSGVVADVWVYNRVAAPSPEKVEVSRDRPPPASRDVVDGSELYLNPKQYVWTFEWRREGNAVVLLRDRKPWAALWAEQSRGITRHLSAKCGWGEPWDDAWYRQYLSADPTNADPTDV